MRNAFHLKDGSVFAESLRVTQLFRREPAGWRPMHRHADPLVERASAEQRTGLLTILSGQAGNAWFEFIASTVGTAYDPQFVPIEFEFDKKKRRARVVIPGALETISGPLILPNTQQENRVTVRLPEGREYLEMEVAQTMVLKGTGAIKFDHRNTHSSMAEVEHTHLGLKARN